MFDLSALPIPGTLIVGCVLYAGASVVAGQVVGARTIAQLGWVEDCQTWIEDSFQSEIDAREEEESLVPKTDCNSIVGGIHPAVRKLCQELNNPDLGKLGGVDAEAARRAERRARELERQQLEDAARGAGESCACAAAVYRREHMIAFALYSGTARLFTPPHIANMESSLQEALSEPVCTNFTGGV